MLSLLDLQRSFRHALLSGNDAAIAELVVDDGIPAAARIDVHRNNMTSSLTEVLKATFPVVCRLVDERFFVYAADTFLRSHPPKRPCLAEYGAEFPEFLAAFPPCQELIYLANVARLEWLLHETALADNDVPLSPKILAGVRLEDTPRLKLQLQRSARYLESRWPIDRIWAANRPDREIDDDTIIDLDSGGTYLQVHRTGTGPEIRSLPAGTFMFRRALHGGHRLGAAVDKAFVVDLGFDPTTAFADLFRESLIIGFTLATPSRYAGFAPAPSRVTIS